MRGGPPRGQDPRECRCARGPCETFLTAVRLKIPRPPPLWTDEVTAPLRWDPALCRPLPGVRRRRAQRGAGLVPHPTRFAGLRGMLSKA